MIIDTFTIIKTFGIVSDKLTSSLTTLIYTFFYIGTSKILMRLNVFVFQRSLALKCSYFVLKFYETFSPANGYRIFYSWRVFSYIPRWGIRLHHKRWLGRCSGHSFECKFLKDTNHRYFSFDFLTCEPQNKFIFN